LAIFSGALAIRWVYDIVLFAAMGTAGLLGADSHAYLADAQRMAAAALSGNLHGWAWLGSDLSQMPLYPWLLALNVAIFNTLAPLFVTLEQALADAGTCLLVYMIAARLDYRIAVPAAIAAALNPTQIVLSGLVYNDTLFTFFVALFLYGAVCWLRGPSWSAALTMGAGSGMAAMERVVVAPWLPICLVILLVMQATVGRVHFRHVAQVIMVAAIFCLGIAPILSRNALKYDTWSLTPQGGTHLALWVVPLVREAKDGTPWERGIVDVKKLKIARYPTRPDNPFIDSQHYAEIARKELAKLGLGAIIKAWAIGATINLASPAIIISPPIAQLPRTGFYATTGRSVFDKIGNFLFHSDNALYAWALLLGIAAVGLVRLLQLCGLFALIRDRKVWPITILLVLWAVFILSANGPVASPKYRLPIEPVLCVLSGAGFVLLRGRRSQGSA
jgi:4-amino-4-deoxy-L-arabinose transferase-like glycosyltransferase